MNFLYYNSKDPLFKTPFGAVERDKKIRFRLRLPINCGVNEAYFLYHIDYGKLEARQMELEWQDDQALYFSVQLKFTENIYWYHFSYKTNSGEHEIFKDSENSEWQLTVYKNSNPKSDLLGGVIYQIFPDRFYRSANFTPKTNNRYINNNWGDAPQWQQNLQEGGLGLDFFGGNLKGIEEKLGYLKSLGVTIIYLNPIFLASSNHRYNTMDYEEIDTLLGTETHFVSLCKAAKQKGIKIILDGVFSHTGDDSKYFDRYHTFVDTIGACVSENSPYRSWYKFKHWPDSYHSWWGVETLPEINEDDQGFLDYICGENGILRHWLRLGADGWRLDVADELPDVFLDRLNKAVLDENPNAYILGEVWEDASNKISYGSRRRYLLGDQLDSVMNYPFANAIINFVSGGNADEISEVVETICENYPKPSLDLLMNHIGTHDTARIITVLGHQGEMGDRQWQSAQKLSQSEYNLGRSRLYIASLLQYTLPGIPSIYYGDEVGSQGWADPFCRGCYPWGNEDLELLEHYKKLGKMRTNTKVFKDGVYNTYKARLGIYSFTRTSKTQEVLVTVNRWYKPDSIEIPESFIGAKVLFGNTPQGTTLNLDGISFSLLLIEK